MFGSIASRDAFIRPGYLPIGVRRLECRGDDSVEVAVQTAEGDVARGCARSAASLNLRGNRINRLIRGRVRRSGPTTTTTNEEPAASAALAQVRHEVFEAREALARADGQRQTQCARSPIDSAATVLADAGATPCEVVAAHSFLREALALDGRPNTGGVEYIDTLREASTFPPQDQERLQNHLLSTPAGNRVESKRGMRRTITLRHENQAAAGHVKEGRIEEHVTRGKARGATGMSGTTLAGPPTTQPIRSWSDVIESYRPAAAARLRWRRSRRPKVSLCIHAFGLEHHLRATIDSCLAQQYAEREFLIIDSGSQDDADEIADAVDDERVRIIPTATTTPIYDSFNLAVQESHGKFVKPICAGDTLHPDCVAKQASILDDDHEVALVAVRTDHVDDDGKLLTHACGVVGLVGRHAAGRAITRIARCSADPVGPPVAGLFRRLGFDECGGCQEDLLFPMDMGLWVRLLSHGEFLKLSTTLASSRIGSGAMTHLLRRAAHRTSAKGGNR